MYESKKKIKCEEVRGSNVDVWFPKSNVEKVGTKEKTKKEKRRKF